MALVIGVPFTGTLSATILSPGDNYLLPAGVVVYSTNGSAIIAVAINHIVTVEGTLIGNVGVTLSSTNAVSISLDVGRTGSVTGTSFGVDTSGVATITNEGLIAGAVGVDLTGGSLINSGRIIGNDTALTDNSANELTVANSGQITSYTGVALSFALGHASFTNTGQVSAKGNGITASGASTSLTFENGGSITSGSFALYADQAAHVQANNSGTITANGIAFATGSGGAFNLTNSGTITSKSSLSFFGDTGIDKVINKGTMNGGVDLHLNNDTYEGNGGRVIGTVSGSSGNDTLNGGAFADRLDGGADNDTINGRGGKDVITGGTGIDKFVFNTTPNTATNVDTITDFKAADDTILLSKAVFAAIAQAAGTLQSQFYWESASGLAHDANDRIIYNTTTGVLSYDSNGSEAGGVQQIAILQNHAAIGATLSNADFLVI